MQSNRNLDCVCYKLQWMDFQLFNEIWTFAIKCLEHSEFDNCPMSITVLTSGFALIGRAFTLLRSHWSGLFLVLFHQQSYAIKNQLNKAPFL